MSNFYPNFNGYTQYYTGSSGNSGQTTNPFGSTNPPYASFPNSAYGNYPQSGGAVGSSSFSQAQQNRSVAESFPSTATIPSVYNALLNPYGQNSPTVNFGQGAGAHGAVGAPVPKSGIGLIKQPSLGTGASYDHLVYNTAAQMIQQQQQAAAAAKAPLASLNPRYPPKPGRGTFPPKRNHYKDVQQLYCEICKISCAGQQTLKEHLEGQKHKKKEALLKGEQPQSIPKNKVSFRCDLCNVTCTGQDTYNAHVRGTKHQKTFALVKKRGGEMPSTEPTIIPPAEYQARAGYAPPPPPPPPLPPSENAPAPVTGVNKARVVGIATVSFVSSSKLNCSQLMDNKKNDATSAGMTAAEIAISSQSDEIKAMIAAEKNVAPVGEDYIESEKDSAGRLIQYNCKLCDCKFSDPNAKEIHLKGRKHRMQYKLKVDPSLEVETKVPPNRRIAARFGGPTRPVPSLLNSIPPWFGTPGLPPPRPNIFGIHEPRRYESVDDRHVQVKDNYIFPAEDFLFNMTLIIGNIEGTMRKISDHFMETRPIIKNGERSPERLLLGVERVGLLAKKLLIKGDTEVELVGLFCEIPTPTILQEVADLFSQKYETCCEKDKGLKVMVSNPAVIISFDEFKELSIRITLTSKFYREPAPDTVMPNEPLNKERCLEALAQVRRAKWFSARCFTINSCNIVIRVLRDLRTRRPAWEPLTDWMLELLAEKILTATPNQVPLGIGDGFRRIIEAVGSGFLSPLGPGILDPCEKGNPDVIEPLTGQQKEDLMYDAQQCLRMIGFNQIYKVLGIERLPDVRPPLGDRKRPLDEMNWVSDDVKKDKRDSEDEDKLNEENLNEENLNVENPNPENPVTME